MKNKIALILILTLIVALCAVFAACKEEGEEDKPAEPTVGLEYTLNEEGTEYSVTSIGTATETDIVIASEHNGLPVTSISDQAFEEGYKITSVFIPGSVKSIGEDAFYNCYFLKSVTMEEGVTSIGSGAFYYCSFLTGIIIPDSVTSIGDNAFYNCYSLTSITIPKSVTSIGESAFCSTSIGVSAFEPCIALTIYCEASSKPSGWDDNWNEGDLPVVWDCNNNDVADDGNVYYTSEDNIRYMLEDGEATVIGQPMSLSKVVLPENVSYKGKTYKVTSIIEYAFKYCLSLTSITIPDNITSIGVSAFEPCLALTIYCEASSKPSGWDDNWNSYDCPIVWDCNNNEIADDGNIYYVSEDNIRYALKDGEAVVAGQAINLIGEVVLPASITYNGNTYNVTSIGTIAFIQCYALTSIVIPDSVTSIGDRAFETCSSLTSITIPDGVTSIGDGAFWGCDSLRSITIPDGVTSIGGRAFSGCSSLESIIVEAGNTAYYSEGNCLIETDSKTLIAGCKNSIIPSDGSVTHIGDHAFYGCSSLTSITIPDSVTSIGDGAFYWCDSLTSITIPEGVTSIGDFAFWNCSSLTSITIPEGVTSIGSFVFSGCYSLESIVVEKGNTVYHSEENCLIETESKTLIAGCKNSIIPSDGSVTGIGEGAFYNCSFLTGITIPDSVTSIGRSAFYNCYSLTSIVIPDGVTSIGEQAFWYCRSLESITIPESVTSIGDYAFGLCDALTSITIPDSVTRIGDSAFFGCSSLESITIPDGVTSIGDNAFAYCRSLESIIFQGSMAQWKAIDKESLWNYGTGSYKVTCTDGVLDKNGNQI